MLIYFRDLLAEKTLICLACLSAIAVMFSIILFPPVSSHLLRVYLTTGSGHNGTGSLGCQSGDLAVEFHIFAHTYLCSLPGLHPGSSASQPSAGEIVPLCKQKSRWTLWLSAVCAWAAVLVVQASRDECCFAPWIEMMLRPGHSCLPTGLP